MTTRKTAEPKKTCPRGHPYTGANVYHHKSGTQSCRICRKAASARFEQRRKEDRA